ncbi:Hypothetical predicted protein [Mytilus galloprovincialis]|nr:Hypothetical predicted protein [Mytilus galloprovincialis]
MPRPPTYKNGTQLQQNMPTHDTENRTTSHHMRCPTEAVMSRIIDEQQPPIEIHTVDIEPHCTNTIIKENNNETLPLNNCEQNAENEVIQHVGKEINSKSNARVQEEYQTLDESNLLDPKQSSNNGHHFRITSQKGLPPELTKRRTNHQEI